MKYRGYMETFVDVEAESEGEARRKIAAVIAERARLDAEDPQGDHPGGLAFAVWDLV